MIESRYSDVESQYFDVYFCVIFPSACSVSGAGNEFLLYAVRSRNIADPLNLHRSIHSAIFW